VEGQVDLFALVQNQVGLFVLIFVRISGIFTTAPIFGATNVPVLVKAGMALIFTLVLLPLLSQPLTIIPGDLFVYILLVIKEYLVGLIIGFVASLLFSAVQMAGYLIDTQIGFSMISVLDPMNGQQVPLIGNFKYILALLVFLATNGHHMLIYGLMASFKAVPVTHVLFHTTLTALLVDMISSFYVVAFKISLPVIVTLLLMDVGMGILARTMPQMNIFIVGMPAKIIVGLFILSIALPFYIAFIEVLFDGIYTNLNQIIQQFIPE
jgi:flagellar biosynthetic protein FliR